MANQNAMTPIESISQAIQEDLLRLRYEDYPLLNVLRKASIKQQNIRWNANVSTDASGAGQTTISNAPNATSDTVVNANLPIGDYAFRKTVQLPEIDIAQASVAGIGELKNLVQAQTRSHVVQILREMNASLYTGDGSVAHAGIYGLDEVAAQTGAYANINQSTHSAWKGAFVLDNGGTGRALTPKLLHDADVLTYRQGTGRYNLIVTSPELVAKYKELFSDERALYTPAVNGQADLGFSRVTYNGVPILFDRDCPVGSMYFVDTAYTSLYNFNINEKPNQTNMSVNGLTFNVGMLPLQNQYSRSFEIGIIPQMQAYDRRAVGKISDLTV